MTDDPERLAAYCLAARLGWPDVDALLDALTPGQWQEWMDYLEWEASQWRRTS